MIAGLSIYTVQKICSIRHLSSVQAKSVGLFAAYALILNGAFILQVSQPSLDPMAQLLALGAATVLIFFKRPFVVGLLIGLAFLTKGLELLPNLAALFFMTLYLNRKNPPLVISKNILFQLLGFLIPIVFWLAHDQLSWNGQWLGTYWNRQFTVRFFNQNNQNTFFDFSILITFFQAYFLEIMILSLGLWKSRMFRRKSDPLFVYFLFYLFFHSLAFFIIKKDSSQHLTGVFLLGAVFVGEYLYEAWQKYNWKGFQSVILILFSLAAVYWALFVLSPYKNKDYWNEIKAESTALTNKDLPQSIVTKDINANGYGIFFTTQWYFYPRKVYFESEANRLIGQEVYLFQGLGDNHLKKTRVVYQPGVF